MEKCFLKSVADRLFFNYSSDLETLETYGKWMKWKYLFFFAPNQLYARYGKEKKKPFIYYIHTLSTKWNVCVSGQKNTCLNDYKIDLTLKSLDSWKIIIRL